MTRHDRRVVVAAGRTRMRKRTRVAVRYGSTTISLFFLLIVIGACSGVELVADSVPPVPPWMKKALPLPAPQGETIHVSSINELLTACDQIRPGGTILVADGHYRLPRVIVVTGKRKHRDTECLRESDSCNSQW